MDNDSGYLDDDAIELLKIPELKSYLRKHGQNVTGRKDDLIQRAKGIAVLKLRNVNDQINTDEILRTERKDNKLRTPLGEKIPEPASLTGWTTDIQHVPEFTDNCVYNYLVLTMKAKRQLKSKIFFQDRHVHSVEYHQVSEDCTHCLVRCKVIPSLPSSNKKENPDYSVWACLSKVTGNVNSADCNCSAGLGEACNHIGALLYALVDISDRRKDGTLASTSMKCQWNNPRKRRLSPMKAEDVSLRKNISPNITDLEGQFKCTFNIERFRQRLIENDSNAGWLTNFSCRQTDNLDHHEVIEDVVNPFKVPFMFCDSKDLHSDDARYQFQSHYDAMSITKEQCDKIEKDTRGQSTNDKWSMQRRGRITSSNFGNVYQRKETTSPDNLVKIIMGYTTFDNKYVKWGRDHEPAARRMYVNQMRGSHSDLEVQQCGLIVNPQYPHLGSSPDGYVYDRCCNNEGIIEIKCPAAERWKFLSPALCAQDSDFFCKCDSAGNVVLKRNHQYYLQIQGQLAITGKKWCDFVVWTLKQPMSIERIYFDADLWNVMLDKLTHFFVNGVIPEMYSSRILRGFPLYH